MDEGSITRYILDNFECIDTFEAPGGTFFFYDPDHKFPFVTLVTGDDYDNASNLSRPSVFRLNIGISKETFRSLFGSKLPPSSEDEIANSEYDFTALDMLMPHPVYGRMYWVCVLNPSEDTVQTAVQPLLAEAYEIATRRYGKKRGRSAEGG